MTGLQTPLVIGGTMNKLQSALFDMMVDMDKVMRENGIMYSLDSGTAIGAVRHKGFIPWDDDADVVIMRKDVDKFVKAFRNLDGYYLQEPFSVDWPFMYYRIRKNGTTAIMKNRRYSRMHQGLFIDVFIKDDYPNSPTARKLFNFLVNKMIIVQKCNYWTYRKSNNEVVFRTVVPVLKVMHKVMDLIVGKNPQYITDRTWFREVKTFDRKYFANTVDIEFEGHMFEIYEGYHEILKSHFGDYMGIPPASKRKKPHIVFFSDEIDYRDYLANVKPEDETYLRPKKKKKK